MIMQYSWAKALQTRLKNMRRKPRAHSSGMEFEPPPAKKKRVSLTNHENTAEGSSILDATSFKRHVSQLDREWGKTARNKYSITSLMKETFLNRRHWIVEDKPNIADVTKQFPALKEYDMVRNCLSDYSVGF